MQLPQYLTTVTPFSKIVAIVLFITLPFVGFYIGFLYGKSVESTETNLSNSYKLLLNITQHLPTKINQPALTPVKIKTCISADKECEQKQDGSSCNYGLWCDEQGRICGGQSCASLTLGKCINNKCELKESETSTQY